MAPVHLYLAVWVLGGVLLGASMLLDAREPAASEDALDGEAPSLAPRALAGNPDPSVLARGLRVLPLGLIGFGLTGLLAKGLDLDLWPWTFLSATSVGLALMALGYSLSWVRARATPR